MISQIKLLLEEVLDTKIDNFSEELNIRELEKWDSVGHINLMMGIENTFKIEISPDQAENIYRIQDIIDVIKDVTE